VIARVRAATARAKPPDRPQPPTVESSNAELAGALATLSASPTAANERRVAAAYRLAGILDKAHEHFRRAVRLNPTDGWAYDGIARVWRDWGTPELGLGDAYRAVHFLPGAPEPLNTLGTILYALGRHEEARRLFREVLRRQPDAAYALNNLCYAAMTLGDVDDAIAACNRALQVAPGGTPARNNLALAHARRGDFDAAAIDLSASGDAASVQYNLGIVDMVMGRYGDAAAAFDAAARLRPTLPFVQERARQARALAGGSDGGR
jgi:tetratricopeptide (TPR) repeat protein